MVYPRKELGIKISILKELEGCTDINNGLGYNVLFERLKPQIKSRSSFHKYLNELIEDGYVGKFPDLLRHKRGVIIFRIGKESELYMHFLIFIGALYHTSRVKSNELLGTVELIEEEVNSWQQKKM